MGAGSKSRTLLLELLLTVFIFSVCMVICASLLLAASKTASDSRWLSEAVFAAQTVAESFKAHRGDIANWQRPQAVGETSVFYYDSLYFSRPDIGDANNSPVSVYLYTADGVAMADIMVLKPGSDQVYVLSVARLASEVLP